MYFLARHIPQNIHANLTFILEFSICPASSGEQRYHLTNVMAALQTIHQMSEDLSKPQHTSLVTQEEIPRAPPKKKKSRMRNTIAVITIDDSDEDTAPHDNSYGVFGPPSKRMF